uniref:Uncharacterized protein n=1 Tax=Palpitomonas bilix TaxID=652834 RepID=A0A7S3LVV4_9EUKA|mmetsp:Transcript_5343/g.12052  ORF Transcript_5343/g.12052 Transcript_5343/m.12052 type:complete len:335 (+) Transcript_5343:295-1299(+)
MGKMTIPLLAHSVHAYIYTHTRTHAHTKLSTEHRGKFNPVAFRDAMLDSFSFGGTYTGFVDGAMRGALLNLIPLKKDVAMLPWVAKGVDSADVQKVLDDVSEAVVSAALKGENLDSAKKEAVSKAKAVKDSKEYSAYAEKAAEALYKYATSTGSEDDQHPSIAQIAILVAAYADKEGLDGAISNLTHLFTTNEFSLAVGQFVKEVCSDVIVKGLDVKAAVQARTESAPAEKSLRENIQKALSEDKSESAHLAFQQKLGLPCGLHQGIPGAVHALVSSTSYVEVVRSVIKASGDSAGRLTFAAPLAAAVHGVPSDFGKKYNKYEEVKAWAKAIVQ